MAFEITKEIFNRCHIFIKQLLPQINNNKRGHALFITVLALRVAVNARVTLVNDLKAIKADSITRVGIKALCNLKDI